ncbi:hypothetical protein BC831DRAFT_476556 [Entophlyctis helioformis]|nr:hypothetical protein BC831DRAFT_476556 [Entophlyctis helioformis]
MVRDWGANGFVQLGDFDYEDDPENFMDQFTDTLGKRFPMFAAIGNHDVTQWLTPTTGYQARLVKQARKAGLHRYCSGEYGINMVCAFNGIVIITSGIGTMGSDHAQFIDDTLTRYKTSPWKLCVWHKNQSKYQTGDKKDETGYEVYDTCRRHGAIVFTSHDHSYARSHLMADFENTIIASNSSTLRVSPGYSFVAVSGLGGDSIRYWKDGREKSPWWAKTAAMDNGVNYGGLLCTFNLLGDSKRAKCKFQDIDGNVWDRFKITSRPFKDDEPAGLGAFAASSSAADVDDDAEEKAADLLMPPPSPLSALKTRLTDTAIASASDITTTDLDTGVTTCGPQRLRLSPRSNATSPTPSLVHTLTFFIKRPVGRVTHAHLQMMAAHPPPAFVAKFPSRRDAYDAYASRTDLAMSIWDLASQPSGCTSPPLASPAHGNQEPTNNAGSALALTDQTSNDPFSVVMALPPSSPPLYQRPYPRPHRLRHAFGYAPLTSSPVVWRREDPANDEPWEAGEVYVSPNIAHVVASAVSRAPPGAASIPVTIALNGVWWTNSNSNSDSVTDADYSRGFYAYPAGLGACVSPSLVVQTTTRNV